MSNIKLKLKDSQLKEKDFKYNKKCRDGYLDQRLIRPASGLAQSSAVNPYFLALKYGSDKKKCWTREKYGSGY